MLRAIRFSMMIVAVNLAVYIIMLMAWMARGWFSGLTDTLTSALALPASVHDVISCPWTPVTYMFTHLSFLHLAVNMLWLIGFGPAICGGLKRIATTYFLGGIAGGAAFLGYCSTSGDYSGTLAGSSAAVIAVVVAAAIISPVFRLRIAMSGDIKIQWLVIPVLTLLFLGSPWYPAETAAHVGGALAGVIMGIILRQKAILSPTHPTGSLSNGERQRILIDKAGQSGYASLSDAERFELFNLTQGKQISR